jgi:beta-lactam-binding protein with PASTA domain
MQATRTRAPRRAVVALLLATQGCGGSSSGPEQVVVPDLGGRSVATAACLAHEAGLRPVDRSGHDLVKPQPERCLTTRAARDLSHPDAAVAEQTPRAGERRARDSVVQIVTGCQLASSPCL